MNECGPVLLGYVSSGAVARPGVRLGDVGCALGALASGCVLCGMVT